MLDREKIVKDMESLMEWLYQQERLIRPGDSDLFRRAREIIGNALELLQEQEEEPRTVLIREDGEYCPYCSTIANRVLGIQKLHHGTRFCPYCGKGIKWEKGDQRDQA